MEQCGWNHCDGDAVGKELTKVLSKQLQSSNKEGPAEVENLRMWCDFRPPPLHPDLLFWTYAWRRLTLEDGMLGG